MKQNVRIGITQETRLRSVDLLRLLPGLGVSAEVCQISEEEAAAPGCDAVILTERDFDLGRELARRSYTAVLILAEDPELLSPACVSEGLLLASSRELEQALRDLMALCARLRLLRQRTNSLRKKLDDTRLVSRAKLLLMTRLQMSEEEAHHYIEQTAMDAGRKSREVAESIIRAYEE